MITYETIIRRENGTYPPELFYVLGALLGDGCAYKWKNTNGHKLILAGDKEFCWNYAKKMSICIGRKVKAYPNRVHNHWFVSNRNDEICRLFKTIRKNPEVALSLLSDDFDSYGVPFIEGFFDAEGCVKLVKERVRKTAKVCPDITNTHFELLEISRVLIEVCLGIRARYSSQEAYLSPEGHPRKKAYHLRIYKKSEVGHFLGKIATTKLCQRKAYALLTWLELNAERARSSC